MKTFFYKDIPFISTKIKVTLGIDEIVNGNSQIVPLSTDIIDEEVKGAIGRKIRLEVGDALKYSQDSNLDILELNEIFYMGKYKGYMEYLNSGKTVNDLVQDVQIAIDVRVEVI